MGHRVRAVPRAIPTFRYPSPLLIGFHESRRAWLMKALTANGTVAATV